MKKTIIIVSVIAILLSVYAGSYLYLRDTKTYTKNGYWMIYLYGDSFVRQYAVDDRAKFLFTDSVNNGDRSFFIGNEGELGDDWFSVYRKDNAQVYRIYRLAETIENIIKKPEPRQKQTVRPDNFKERLILD